MEPGADVRLTVRLGASEVPVSIAIDGARSEHVIERRRLDAVVAALERSRVSPLPAEARPAHASGVELSLAVGFAEAMFRWVGAPPEGWEPLAEATRELLQIGYELTHSRALAP